MSELSSIPGYAVGESAPIVPEDNPRRDATGFSPELEPYVPEAERFLKQYQELFLQAAGDRSLSFKVGNGFFIDLKQGVIHVDVRDWQWAKERGLSEWQQVWSTLHEVSHFRDLREAPKEMLNNFVYMEQRAKELVPEVQKIYEDRGIPLPDYLMKQQPVGEDPARTMSGLEHFLYKRLHLLYNSLDDMYVNLTLGNRSAIFHPVTGSQAPETTRLYRDYLFPTEPKKIGAVPQELQAADYATLPKSYQLAYWLLRRRMVPDQEILVTPEVTEILNGYRDTVAEQLGITFAKEVSTITQPGNSKSRNPGWRYQQIRERIEPTYIKLLMEDLAILPPPPPPSDGSSEPSESDGQPGDGLPQESPEPSESGEPDQPDSSQPGDQEGKPDTAEKKAGQPQGSPWDELDGKPEPIDLDTIKDFIAQQDQKAKENWDAEQKQKDKTGKRLTPQERQDLAQQQKDHAIAEKNAIDPQVTNTYRQLEASVRDYKRELAVVFEEFMRTINERLVQFWDEGFRSGKVNVDRFIRKYGPDIASDQVAHIPWETLDVYDQREFESRLQLFPNEVRVRFVLDGSGSMNPERIFALQQLIILFEEGLATLEATLNLRFRLKNPFMIDTEVSIFGSKGCSQIIKPFNGGTRSAEEEIANRFRGFSKIGPHYGGTCDAEPFWKISESLTPEQTNKLKEGAAREFIFEVTDGGSNEPSAKATQSNAAQDTRNAIAAVEQSGVIAFGFQIGEPSEEEKATFKSVWGAAGASVPHPKDLARTVSQLFTTQLKTMPLAVQQYEMADEEDL